METVITNKRLLEEGILLERSFLTRDDTQLICCDLLGKFLFTNIAQEGLTGGIICEVEAYLGGIDMSSHAYRQRKTKRNESLYKEGGVTYVHMCYGHFMLNIVTRKAQIPHGILIRGLIPLYGIDVMLKRRNKTNVALNKLANGPGNLTKSLGINMSYNGMLVCKDNTIGQDHLKIFIEDRGLNPSIDEIIKTSRIGVGYAGKWANVALRFVLSDKFWSLHAKN